MRYERRITEQQLAEIEKSLSVELRRAFRPALTGQICGRRAPARQGNIVLFAIVAVVMGFAAFLMTQYVG